MHKRQHKMQEDVLVFSQNEAIQPSSLPLPAHHQTRHLLVMHILFLNTYLSACLAGPAVPQSQSRDTAVPARARLVRRPAASLAAQYRGCADSTPLFTDDARVAQTRQTVVRLLRHRSGSDDDFSARRCAETLLQTVTISASARLCA